MKKKIYIYDNARFTTGVTASEFFTKSYDGGDCEELEVEIPEELKPYEADAGTVITVNGYKCFLDELLKVDRDEKPYIDGRQLYGKVYKLKFKSNGRKSRAFTI